MDSLTAYARDWLESRGFIGQALGRYSLVNDYVLLEEERARPGFARSLRAVALESLTGDDPELRRRAVRVLAYLGTPDDMPRLAALAAEPDQVVAREARAALWEVRWKKYRPVWRRSLFILMLLAGVLMFLTILKGGQPQ
ncbi:MAG TPA: HEAT repeat domain-containing protein [Gemmatimonadales bacterium]